MFCSGWERMTDYGSDVAKTFEIKNGERGPDTR